MAYDYIVIGSGFGGSVAALRLTEKGYRVAVIEAGRRCEPEDFPRSNWKFWKYLWAPGLRCFGFQRIQVLDHMLALGGCGVGGGSLVYCNTLFEPPDDFYRDEQWRDMSPDWKAELAPHFQKARRMLGVVTNPRFWPTVSAPRKWGSFSENREKPSRIPISMEKVRRAAAALRPDTAWWAAGTAGPCRGSLPGLGTWCAPTAKCWPGSPPRAAGRHTQRESPSRRAFSSTTPPISSWCAIPGDRI